MSWAGAIGRAVRGMRRACWRGVATVLFALGALGLTVPGLPTTIFWILAAAAAAKSDPALAARIRAWPLLGRVVSDYLDHGVIPRRVKVVALAAMTLSGALLALLAPLGWPFAAALAALGLGGLYVATRPGSAAHPSRRDDRASSAFSEEPFGAAGSKL